MTFDDQTEIRHKRETKALWRAAAAKMHQKLSAWMRETLIAEARRILSADE